MKRVLTDPSTGRELATIGDSSPDEVDAAIRAASAAGTAWGRSMPSDRSAALLRLADLLEPHADELSRIECNETGKPWTVMRDGEMPFALDNLRFFAASARNVDGTAAGSFSTGYTSMLLRRPAGVVAAITPWNFPLVMAIWKVGAALAADAPSSSNPLRQRRARRCDSPNSPGKPVCRTAS